MVDCRRALGAVAVGAMALLGAAACGDSSNSSSLASSAAVNAPSTAKIAIPGADRFSPFLTNVAANGTIVITNTDTDEHTVTSLPGAAVKFDVHVKGNGATATLVLPAGTYRYYCTIHAKYIVDTDQVAALPSAGFPDQPMEGVITVS